MSGTGEEIDVRITAQVNDLKVNLAVAREEVRQTAAEVKKLAAEAAAAGGPTAEMATKIAAAQVAAAAAKKEFAAMGGSLSSSHGSISTATREFRALFDELSSGRTRMTPGTLAIIAQRVFGLSGAALAGAGAVVGLVAAIGYLIVKSIEASNALERLKLSADFGGNLDISREQLHKFADEAGKDGDEIVAAFARMGSMSADELEALSIATAQYAEAAGEKGPEAAKQLTTALTSQHLSLAELQKLFPAVTEAERENFLAVQQLGDAHKTAAALVGLVQDQVKGARADLITYSSGWTSVGNDVRLVAGYIQELTGDFLPLSSVIEGGIKEWDRYGGALGRALDSLRSYTGFLHTQSDVDIVHGDLVAENTKRLEAQAEAARRAAAATAAKKESDQAAITAALQTGEAFNTEGRHADELAGKIKQMQDALARPGVTGDQAAKLRADIADAQRQADDAAKRPKTEEFNNFVAMEDAKVDATKSGSAQRIAALQDEVAKAKELFGAESTEAYRKEGELAAARREGAAAGVTAARQGGQEEIAAVQEKISEINADETLGGKERQTLINAAYRELLASTRLTGEQRVEVEKEFNAALTAEHKRAAEEQASIDRSNTQTALELARIGFQEKRDLLDQEVAEGKITRAQELQDLLVLTKAEGDAEQQSLTDAEKGYASDSAAFTEAENKKRLAAATTQAQIDKINAEIAANARKTAQADAQAWKMATDEITSAETTMIDGLLSRNTTFMGALENATSSFIKKELAADIAYYTKKMLLSKEDFAADQAHEQGGILVHAFAEAQKTAATTAGEATRVGEKASAAAAGSAIDVASGSAQIMNDAYKAAAGTYSAVAQIPYVGPYIAPAAAAAAFAVVAGFDQLTSLDVGTGFVPRDMPARLHTGEIVAPRPFSDDIRSGKLSLGRAGGNSQTNHFHYNPGITNNEQKSLGQMLHEDSGTARTWFQKQIRSGALRMP